MEITDREYEKLRKKAADYDDNAQLGRFIIGGLVTVVVLIIGIIFLFRIVGPKLNLYKANTEKQSVIKEQQAISEAEVYAAEKRVIAATAEAEARVIEAQGIADSQAIIAATLTPEYLQWRYYEVLATTDNQVIYVPADGLPVTEAGRATASTPAP